MADGGTPPRATVRDLRACGVVRPRVRPRRDDQERAARLGTVIHVVFRDERPFAGMRLYAVPLPQTPDSVRACGE